MCGISGIFARGDDPDRLAQLVDCMVRAQRHRGPDAEGLYVDAENHCVLGHNRLSIIDLSSAGRQPMHNEGDRQVISFNGEIYNFQELRSQLAGERSFSSRSDTEVILAAYERWGTEAFARLNGMFAFALLDRERRQLILVRDRLGIKPLHFLQVGGKFAFASEIKGLLASRIGEISPNLSRLHEYLYFGNTLGTHTFFEGIQRLPAGHWMALDIATGALSRPHRYWSANDLQPRKNTGVENDLVGETQALLEKAVQRQLTSDVPVGAFLSGGVDSSAIVALATRHYPGRLRTYTVGFDYLGDGEELPNARRIAAHFGTEHHEIHVSGRDIEHIIERLAIAHDQPFADPANIPLFQLCQALEGETKVVLQGDGGDELFGGYRRYSYLRAPRLAAFLAGVANLGFEAMNDRYGHRVFGAHRFFYALSRRDPAERMGLLLSVEGPLNPPTRILNAELRALAGRQDPFIRYRAVIDTLPPVDSLQKMLLTDLQILLPDIFLEKVDRSTMAMSTEIRVPFLDFELVDYVAALPSDRKVGIGRRKKLLRQALQGIVPPDILKAPKSGFGVPIAQWLAGPLRSFAEDRIRAHTGPGGWFDDQAVRNIFEEHASGRRNHAQLLWKALQCAIWCDQQPFRAIATT